MTEKTLTTENIKPALDALRGELAPWPVVAMKQDKLNNTQKSAVNSGITSSLVAQIIANTAAIRALESAITGTGLRALVVASLPAVGTTGILYIVPVTTYDPDTDADVVNYSNEYIWIPVEGGTASEGHYEQVGQTGIVINNGQLTITVNGTSVGTFTANQSGDTTAAITVPTNADYVDRTTDQTVAGVKTFSSTINGTAAKAIADEDGTSIKSGYVNVAGNQTVTGQKTWSGNQFYTAGAYHRNNSYEIGNTPASNVVMPIYFTDKVNVNTGYVRNVILTTGKTQSELLARNKFTNGALSPTGTDVSSILQVEVQSNGDKTLYFDGSIRNNVLPYATNSYSLGSSSYQWSSVYAQSYYYNGTAWGLDKENTWTGTNNFSTLSLFSNSVTYNEAPSSNVELPSIRIFGGGRYCGAFDYVWRSTGENVIRLSLGSYKSDGAFGYWACNFGIPRDFSAGGKFGTPAFYPNNNNSYDLGTSTNQWSSVYAQSYYYNGTAWGLDQSNNWTGINIFTGSVILPAFGSNNYKNYGIVTDYGYTQANNYYRFLRTTGVYNSDNTPDTSKPSFLTFRPMRLQTELMDNIQVCNDGTNNYLAPITTGITNLGTSTNKWKTLNGINPGALSLPDCSVYANIDRTGWVYDGGITQNLIKLNSADTVITSNGWLYIRINNTVAGDYFGVRLGGSTEYNPTSIFGESGIGHIDAFVPVVQGFTASFFSTKSPTHFKFYPCLGNV